MRDRIWLGFSVDIESDLFLVRGIEIGRLRAEVNLFWVLWSMDFVFVWVVVVNIDLDLDAGRKSLCYSVSIEIDLVYVWVDNIGLISVWRLELDLISV